ncbi:hypothetical protein A3C26_00710 [Candidatus Daviesbacteria bacterium RIFCSPHIGHO2_02_FULL_39_12]|uniref:SpoVT-AbrB domain-containing protein n=2 Tax=Candidatus Daviesiibacteriota TaxID=1752718 RepID=A0A1F5J9M1_9BACT|nr:MAG: hypothetical protein A3C26_00710 [Candidatus Daviesbacteria bacterium RIFCSPHIGHO2_02_FULL_39_12]OGE72527.1 MAG: hypothetical protein A3H40_00295 [Candidatus Daviesbacteria bacterium RIFCSPLOWO2_02_FULL_38_15]
MKQIIANRSQEEYLRILGKGMVTIPKEWRDELGLEEGQIVKAQRMGNKVIIESSSEPLPYRIFNDEEIEQWLKDDKLPKILAKKIDNKASLLLRNKLKLLKRG